MRSAPVNAVKGEPAPYSPGGLPAKAADVPAKAAEVPAKAAEVPAKTAEVPAKTAEVSAKTAEVSAKAAEVPAKAADIAVKAPNVLVDLKQAVAKLTKLKTRCATEHRDLVTRLQTYGSQRLELVSKKKPNPQRMRTRDFDKDPEGKLRERGQQLSNEISRLGRDDGSMTY